MKSYIVITPLRNGGTKPIPTGDPVELPADEGDALAAIGALSPAGKLAETVAEQDNSPTPPPPAAPTPTPPAPLPDEAALNAMSKPKLIEQAKLEKVTFSDDVTNNEGRVKAILDARKAG